MEHVATSLGDGRHLGDDGQVVYDEGHLVLLVLGEVLGVAEQTEPSDVSGTVSVVLVHQDSGWGNSIRFVLTKQNRKGVVK